MAYKHPYNYDEPEYKEPKLDTNRSMWKFMILNILTLGFYSIWFFIPFSFDIDKISPKRDGTKTMNYLFAFIVAYFTGNIVMWIWHYQIADRVEMALLQSDIDYEFSTKTYWGWYFFGSFIFIGSFIYFHKLFKAMNLLCEDYNNKHEVE